MEGLPTVEMNRRIIEAGLAEAQQLRGDKPFLVKPTETPIDHPRSYPFGTPARIPSIRCIGRWRGQFESRGDLDGWAELTVLWFQEQFAIPIAENIVSQIQALDWNRHSIFYEA